jgi:hypothetical protein
VISGNHTTARNLAVTRARVADLNGAGIRLDAGSDEGVKFTDSQNRILGGGSPGAKIVIRNSDFEWIGFCAQDCAHGIAIGEADVVTGRAFAFLQYPAGLFDQIAGLAHRNNRVRYCRYGNKRGASHTYPRNHDPEQYFPQRWRPRDGVRMECDGDAGSTNRRQTLRLSDPIEGRRHCTMAPATAPSPVH